MKLVCDEGVEKPVVQRLRDAGHDVIYIAEETPGISDDQVLARANEAGALLITSDKDFGELVYRLGHVSGGVFLLRLAGATNEEKAEMVELAIGAHAEELKGCFSVLTAKQLRIRRSH